MLLENKVKKNYSTKDQFIKWSGFRNWVSQHFCSKDRKNKVEIRKSLVGKQ